MARGADLQNFADTHGLNIISIEQIIHHRITQEVLVRNTETRELETDFGIFNTYVFLDEVEKKEHLALVYGDLAGATPLVRVHSECLTGDAFGSLRCDCGDQLASALKMIEEEGQGVVLYMRQEGRGIGLANKIRAYALQDQGHDTVDANLLLNLPADDRKYDMCSIMLGHLQIEQVRLITNNPLKLAALKDLGIDVTDRVPLTVGLNPFNAEYLKTKHDRMSHMYQKDDF